MLTALLLALAALAFAKRAYEHLASAKSRNIARAKAEQMLAPDIARLDDQARLQARLSLATESVASFDFTDWLHKTLPAAPAPAVSSRPEESPLWKWRIIETTWANISASRLGEIIESAESLSPPLRLISITVDPVDQTQALAVKARWLSPLGGEQ
jgi:hypothetical protein